MNYFEFNERRTQRSVAVDVIDWPGITVTESEPNEDQLLELSLMQPTGLCPLGPTTHNLAMEARGRCPGCAQEQRA